MNLYNYTFPKFTAEASVLSSESTLDNPDNYIRSSSHFQTAGENIRLAQRCPPCGECGVDKPGFKECFVWLPGPQECISRFVRCGGGGLNCCQRPVGSPCP